MIPVITRREGQAFPLEAEQERALKDSFLPVVQSLAPGRVTADDFHLRGMYLCNSARDYYYSRFTRGALDEIADLLAGRPVMVGHDYGTLPVGRFVHGEVVERKSKAPKRDNQWVKGLFYVPRDEQGDAVVRRIDTGIYREVSIGWRCLDATCSECKNDIRDRERCEHWPGEVYDDGICEYQFSGITAVLEGSLVFAGGQKDTSTFVPQGEAASRIAEPAGALSWDRLADYCRQRDAALPAPLRAERASRAGARQRSRIVSIGCSRKRFDSRAEAARWVRDHDFRADKPTDIEESFLFVQRAGKGDRTLMLDDHVTALVESGEKPARGLTVEQFMKGA